MIEKLKFRFLQSEKSLASNKKNQIVIVTSDLISKEQITNFLASKYDVTVSSINSLIVKGKHKFRKKVRVKLPDRKKFYISLSSGFEKLSTMDNKNA